MLKLVKQMQLLDFLRQCPFAISLLPVEINMSDVRYFVRFTSDFQYIEFGFLSDTWHLQLSDVC